MHAVIYIDLVLSLFTDKKLERIIGLPYLRISTLRLPVSVSQGGITHSPDHLV